MGGSSAETATRPDRLAMAFHRDPLDPRSWSGTPARIAAALADHGWHVDGVTTAPGPLVAGAVRRLHRASGWGPDSVRNPIMRRVAARRAATRLQHLGPDVALHIGTLHLPLPAAELRRRTHACYVDTTWSTWQRFGSEVPRYHPRFLASAERLEAVAYHQMHHVFTASVAAATELVSHYGLPPDRVTAVGTGLGQHLPDVQASPRDEPRLLFVGKHRLADKGLDILLEAMPAVRRAHPGTRLTVVGRPQDVGEVEGVEVRSWVEPEELARLYVDADLFVMPARNEPWGLVYLEALSMGTPVLGVDRHAFREIAADGAHGVVVDAPEAGAVASAIAAALMDRDALAEAGERGRRHVLATASWDRVARQITDELGKP